MLIKRLSPIVLLLLAFFIFVSTADAEDNVVWSTYGSNQIGVAGLDGSGGSALDTDGATVAQPFGTAVDATSGRVYWGNQGDQTINWAALDGSGGGELDVSGTPTIGAMMGLAVWPEGGKIFWGLQNDSIGYADLDGSGGGSFDTGTAPTGNDVSPVVDTEDNRLYWSDRSTNQIGYASLNGDGSDSGTVDTAGATSQAIDALTVDPAAGVIYWTNETNPPVISYADLDGSGAGDITQQSGFLYGLAFDQDTDKLIFSEFGSQIYEIGTDGTGLSTVDTPGFSGTGYSFPVLISAPKNTVAPQLTGSGDQVGSVLNCGDGTWADGAASSDYRSPASFTYAWKVNGNVVSDTTETIKADTSGAWTCSVTAANYAGTSTATSNTVKITPKSDQPVLPEPPANPTSSTPTVSVPSAATPTPLLIQRFRLAPTNFRINKQVITHLAKISQGTQIRFNLTGVAEVRFWIRHDQHRRPLRHLPNGFVRTLQPGKHSVSFSGVFPGKPYQPGAYTLYAKAYNPTTGATSPIVKAGFRILPSKK